MKKILPYILIFLVVVQFFAPLTVGMGEKDKVEFRNNKAEANDSIRVTTTGTALDTTMSGTVHVVWGNSGMRTSESKVIVFILDKAVPQKVIYTYPIVFHDVPKGPTESYADSVQEGTFNVPNLTPSTDYEIRTVASQNILGWWGVVVGTSAGIVFGTIGSIAGPVGTVAGVALGVAVLTPNADLNNTTTADPLVLRTNKSGDTKTVSTGQSTTVNEDAILPVCSWASSSTWGGCVGTLLYWGIFKPSSYIFGLTGRLLDISIDYSTKDTSYRSPFVLEGWKIVRDFCNLFFIFVLLYIAFGTILGLNGVKTKEMIVNVVIIGLLINFSLFTTQVIIDASNILTRVFYNSNTIKVGPKIGGVIQDQRGSQGEIKISEAIVAKINPQKLILEASKANNIPSKQSVADTLQTTNGITASTFILVTILASVVNIVGLIVFLMSSLIFIARVIGLWLAMILAPLVFFTYTVPQLQDMEMIGWKKWWPETIKLAFLAPIFMFFMYLIIKFLDSGLGLAINDTKGGLDFILGIFIPFIFIMILLTKAKDIAKTMSGKMGQTITNGLAAAGGIALGGTALGTAFLGRKLIGAGLASASRTDSAQHFATQKIAHNKELEKWEAGGKAGPKPVFTAPVHGEKLKNADGTDMVDKNGKVKTYNALSGRIGGNLNATQNKVGAIDRARHDEDQLKKDAGQVDENGQPLENSRITGEGITVMKNKYKQNKQSDAESAARKGFDVKGDVLLTQTDDAGNVVTKKDANGEDVPVTHKGEEAYKSANRGAIVAELRKDPKNINKKTNELTAEAQGKLTNELNIKLNAAVKIATDQKLTKDFETMRGNAAKQVNPLTRGFAGANKSSYDVRKMSDLKSDSREGMFSKIPVGMIAAVALGVRGGLKNVGTSSGGVKVEGNFMKDLGNTISDSLKGTKVNVDLSHVGETKSSADAHGGGGHH